MCVKHFLSRISHFFFLCPRQPGSLSGGVAKTAKKHKNSWKHHNYNKSYLEVNRKLSFGRNTGEKRGRIFSSFPTYGMEKLRKGV
jgi:hypothetical protein